MNPRTYPKSILYIDSDPTHLEAFQSAFGADYSVHTCLTGSEAVEIMERQGDQFPLLIVDQKKTDLSGVEVCEKVAAIRPFTIRMILTTLTDTKFFLDAINRGRVHDCVLKPWTKEGLKPILENGFQEYEERMTNLHEAEISGGKPSSEKEEIREMTERGIIIGEGLKPIMEIVRKAAMTDSTVLIQGETGTGKELVAYTIHEKSGRKNGPFVPVHCAALAQGLMESELFGHKKGAFTGADQNRMGRFEVANHGTIFLDEIGELSEEIQVKLLRVLQEREIYRVGENRPINVDVRLVAATHRNLEEMVRKGNFREDLFYRLNVINIRLPPLRERKEEIPQLATEFLKKVSQGKKELSLSQEALEFLSRYNWPGNIRELQNVVERAAALSEGDEIMPEDFNLNIEQPLRAEQINFNQVVSAPSLKSMFHQEEKKKLSDLLIKVRGNVAEAARVSGIPRSTLFHRLRKYGLV